MGGWIKTKDALPQKPGLRGYEQIDCLIFVKGAIEHSVWNCEHECWDDSYGDDWKYDPLTPTHWMPLPAPPEAT